MAVRAGYGAAAGVAVPAGAAIGDAWRMVCGAIGISEDEFAALVVTHARLTAAQWERADAQALRLLPERLARQYKVFPMREDDRAIYVATSDPNDLDAEQAIGFASGRVPVFEIATPAQIMTAIDAGYAPVGHAEKILKAASRSDDVVRVVSETGPESVNVNDITAAPIVSLANMILRDAVTQRASDIHVEPGRLQGVVRYRVDGVMREYLQLPMPVHNRVVSRLKVTGNLDIADRHRPQDGRCRIMIADKSVDLRISTVPTRESEKIVIRVLDAANTKRLGDISLPAPELTRLRRLISQRDGIVVVTGPTGSGKTTTLYAALGEVARGEVNVTTIEDPVEYELPGITQIQVDARRQVTFGATLRAVLRQDPDVIFVGEIRDAETAEVAAHAALTGHLVLTTLHTNDSVGVVNRLADLGLDRATISASLRGVLAQRLVRRLCSKCSARYAAPYSEEEIRLHETAGVMPVKRQVGCETCGHTGYWGRLAIPEVLVMSDAMAEQVAAGATHGALLKLAKAEGLRLMLDVALEAVARGDTTLAEVDRVIGLRAQAPQAEPEVHEETGAGFEEPDASSGRPRVLVVDDDPVIRGVVKALLEKESFAVTEATDGETALAAVADAPSFDLIILDLGLPTMNGRQVLKRIREDSTHATVPVIVLTGSEDEEDEVVVMDEGADDYLRKPIAAARFASRCRAAIRRRAMART
jgi:type II secretory ATPase GspE/PulE/Tfp pilus assembly ATPase PilB-like protein/ActR/RegA family two-component response regulator